MQRHEIGMINGQYYKLVYSRRKDQQACDRRYENEYRWFLWIGGNTNDYFVGDFRTKKEAYCFIKEG